MFLHKIISGPKCTVMHFMHKVIFSTCTSNKHRNEVPLNIGAYAATASSIERGNKP